MTLPANPPRYTSWSDTTSPIQRGEAGWRSFALQKALNSIRWISVDSGLPQPWSRIDPDGDFGEDTLTVLKAAQNAAGLNVDGIAGTSTQRTFLAILARRVHVLLPGVPDGLMRGFAEAEGANLLAATNWSVPGGVDCGCVQLRVYGPPYSLSDQTQAFDPISGLMEAATAFLARAVGFYDAPYVRWAGTHRTELAMRCAVMAHNWPAGADAIAKTGLCYSPNSLASWVPAGVTFPDGAPVRTRWEWCQFYALGGPHGEGSVTAYVRSWS